MDCMDEKCGGSAFQGKHLKRLTPSLSEPIVLAIQIRAF